MVWGGLKSVVKQTFLKSNNKTNNMAQITRVRKGLSSDVHSLINAKARFERVFGQSYYTYLSNRFGSKYFYYMKDNLNKKIK